MQEDKMNIRGQDLWRSQRSPEIFLTNKLSRSGVTNLITGQRELREILLEARSKIGSLAIISLFVRPGIPRNEHFAGDIRTSCGRTQTKYRVCKHLDLVECPANCRPDHRSRKVDSNTRFCPCKFTGIARQKIIHSLLCSEFRNRW